MFDMIIKAIYSLLLTRANVLEQPCFEMTKKEGHFKVGLDEKCFLFHLNSFFRSQDI